LGNLTTNALADEWVFWNKEPRKLRFGQYIMNRYSTQPWPELYYEEDHKTAYMLCFDWIEAQ
jgi:hypothetical protein